MLGLRDLVGVDLVAVIPLLLLDSGVSVLVFTTVGRVVVVLWVLRQSAVDELGGLLQLIY